MLVVGHRLPIIFLYSYLPSPSILLSSTYHCPLLAALILAFSMFGSDTMEEHCQREFVRQLRTCTFSRLLDKTGGAATWLSEDVGDKRWQEIVAQHMSSLPDDKDPMGNDVDSQEEQQPPEQPTVLNTKMVESSIKAERTHDSAIFGVPNNLGKPDEDKNGQGMDRHCGCSWLMYYCYCVDFVVQFHVLQSLVSGVELKKQPGRIR